jgi:hypothetical protein
VTTDNAEVQSKLDELDALRAEFPAYLFCREQLPGRARYAARTAYLEVHPYAVVTADLAELRRALALAQEPGSPPLAAVLPVRPNVVRIHGHRAEEDHHPADQAPAGPVATVVPEVAETASASLPSPAPYPEEDSPARSELAHRSQLPPVSEGNPGGRSALAQPPRPAGDAGTSQALRRRVYTRSVLDLLWKIDSRAGRWSGTLRTDRRVIVTAGDGDELAERIQDLTLAILEGRGAEALHAMRSACGT